MSLLFVVPSRERAHWLIGRKTNTLNFFTNEHKPVLYVRIDDSQLAAYYKLAEAYGVELMLQPSTALGAAQTYDSLIDYGISKGYEKLIILDDDLTFKIKNINGGKPDFTYVTPKQADAMIEHFASITCDQLPACSMTPIMTRSQPSLIVYAKPLMWAYSYHLPHFAKHPEHRFWQGKHIEARCDLNLALNILTSGYLTAYMATCYIPDNVNNPGGCSTYRTLELEKQSVKYLVDTYPEFVKTHKQKGWVGDDEVERDAPTIAWMKAFNKEKFQAHFGEDVNVFIKRHLKEYERTYANFIKECRK